MSEMAVTVSEAARDFLGVLDRVGRAGAPVIIVREGGPVATLIPLPEAALTCTELAGRWAKLDKLPPDEANAFADDVAADVSRLKLSNFAQLFLVRDS